MCCLLPVIPNTRMRIEEDSIVLVKGRDSRETGWVEEAEGASEREGTS